MSPIYSVEAAKAAFPHLKWRDAPSFGNGGKGKITFAIMGGDKRSGDVTILLAMEDGARAPTHFHNERPGWPYRETITMLIGVLHDVFATEPDRVLRAGETIDLADSNTHAPSVASGGFALLIYRQPAGHTQMV